MTNWTAVQSMPANYVFPPEKRPGKQTFPNWNDISIIDLQKFDGLERHEIIQQIMKACQDFGIFQVHSSNFCFLFKRNAARKPYSFPFFWP